MSNVPVRTFTPYINKLRKEAEDLRNHTTVEKKHPRQEAKKQIKEQLK